MFFKPTNITLTYFRTSLLPIFSPKSFKTQSSYSVFFRFHRGSFFKMSVAESKVFIVAGPSGVGKGTLINKLFEEFPNKFAFSVSHTTRKPRPGEVDGEHYNFTTIENMEKDIKENKFVEYAHVHGNIYGTSKAAIEKITSQGKTCILDIDIQGCQKVKKTNLKAKYIFIAPPSVEELEKRLRGRGTESEDSIQTRLTNAHKELEFLKQENFFDKIIVNDELERAYQEFKQFILE